MNDKDEARLNVRAWIEKADLDFTFADHGTENESFSEPRAFHYQQATEKYIKALLISLGIEPNRTHDIGRLLDDCEKAGIEGVETIRKAERLSAYAVEPRYPSDIVSVSLEEAEIARQITETVRQFVLARLPFSLDD